MELKEGMYARTLDGICKIIELRDNGIMTRFRNEDGNIYFTNDMMCNPSFNVIDLLQAGDYVNGERVTVIEEGIIKTGNEVCKTYIHNSWIKSIVTKEQFESMEYKVGE